MCWIAVLLQGYNTPGLAGNGEITLIHMGDIHGHLLPRPSMRAGEQSTDTLHGGIAYLYDQVQKIRSRKPDSVLINTGDSVQGSAEALFTRGEAVVRLLNEFRIDVFVPGNWDFVYGTERFRELFGGVQPLANWNAVAANLYYTTLYEFPLSPYPNLAGQRVLPPYFIKQVGAVKVGFIGLTADRGPQAVSKRVMDGFFLSPGEEELAQAIGVVRSKEQVDLVVLLSERGLGANLDMVERIQGVDIVLSSDSHEETREVLVARSGTRLVEAGQDGTLLGEINLTVRDKKITRWLWHPYRINTRDNKPDVRLVDVIDEIRRPFVKGAQFTAKVNPINGAVLRTPIDAVIGTTQVGLHRSNAADATSMPAVVEGSSHNFLADAFRIACNAEVGEMRGFRYGTHIEPGPIRLEDLYHFIPIGPQIACGEVSGDEIRLQIEKSAEGVFSPWVTNWGGGWLNAYSGVSFDLDPFGVAGHRVSNLRINGEAVDVARTYNVAGYWYIDDANKINRDPALNIRVLKDQEGGIVDATEVVAFYLQSLPNHRADPQLNRIRLTRALPKPIGGNKEIQPWRGVARSFD